MKIFIVMKQTKLEIFFTRSGKLLKNKKKLY